MRQARRPRRNECPQGRTEAVTPPPGVAERMALGLVKSPPIERRVTVAKKPPPGRLGRLQEGLLVGVRMVTTARAQTGKSIRSQLADLVALRRWRVGPREYYKYRLFDDARFTPLQKREYTGWRFERAVYKTINDPGLLAPSGLEGSWGGMVDKLVFDSLMRAGEVPTPEILAVFDPA